MNPAWVKGVSGNPKGRPKKNKSFAEVADALLNAKKVHVVLTLPDGTRKNWVMEATVNFRHVVAASLLREAMTGNVSAAKELIDRTDGKVTEKIDHIIRDGQHLSEQELEAIARGET